MPFDVDKFARELQEEIMRDVRQRYSPTVIQHWMTPVNFKRMEDPDGYGRITGSCGDTMEMYIKVTRNRLTDASFFTDGCGTTIACGSLVVSMAQGKPIEEAARIDKGVVLGALGGLPEEDQHCAELAANALRYAIVDYESAASAGEEEKRRE